MGYTTRHAGLAGKFAFALTFALTGIPSGFAVGSGWTTVYRDNYDYSTDTATFNTWFWREDSTATHGFNVTTADGACSAATPCVKLTALASPDNTAYVNAEMYNNSCPRYDDGSLDSLKKTAWGRSLYAQIVFNCGLPYPYRVSDPKTPSVAPTGVTNSWITRAAPVPRLNQNTFAFSAFDAESPWKAVRDAAFNNPFSLQRSLAVRMTADIKAETSDQGGSRGWGFWNTTMNPADMQLAWFMEYSQPGADGARGVYAQTIGKDAAGKWAFCQTKLPDAAANGIYDGFHQYAVMLVSMPINAQRSANAVIYAIDGNAVATHLLKVDQPMAFHNWVDNRDYTNAKPANYPLTKDKSNLIRRFVVQRIERAGRGDGELKSIPMTQSEGTTCVDMNSMTPIHGIAR
ncbi:hypothetical protein [Pandoraea sp. PE-S2R-1]|uniref:hypothetical protein n=1 Tax=Pandoraea sp. PE-S2R-1 TaxID=1986994 RepID=UPI000B3F8AC5|nr:hypothetical protein [Pandoraea sp. PE-S2R-1]